jgi:hypothetical protein
MSSGEKKSVAIPAELYSKLAAGLETSGAESVDELVGRIVRDWISKEASKGAVKKPSAMPKEDEKVVEERLKALGYF